MATINRPYTMVFYMRIVKLYEKMPAKKVAKIMRCAESTVRSAKFRLATKCNETQRAEISKTL